MPFDGVDAPPAWRRAPGPGDQPGRPADLPWSQRDRLVATAIALVLAVITLGECRMLLASWLGHGA